MSLILSDRGNREIIERHMIRDEIVIPTSYSHTDKNASIANIPMLDLLPITSCLQTFSMNTYAGIIHLIFRSLPLIGQADHAAPALIACRRENGATPTFIKSILAKKLSSMPSNSSLPVTSGILINSP